MPIEPAKSHHTEIQCTTDQEALHIAEIEVEWLEPELWWAVLALIDQLEQQEQGMPVER